MSLPKPQLNLDDLYQEMLDRLTEHNDALMATGDDGEPMLNDEQITALEREFVWEFLCRALLLDRSCHSCRQVQPPFAREKARATTPPHVPEW